MEFVVAIDSDPLQERCVLFVLFHPGHCTVGFYLSAESENYLSAPVWNRIHDVDEYLSPLESRFPSL